MKGLHRDVGVEAILKRMNVKNIQGELMNKKVSMKEIFKESKFPSHKISTDQLSRIYSGIINSVKDPIKATSKLINILLMDYKLTNKEVGVLLPEIGILNRMHRQFRGKEEKVSMEEVMKKASPTFHDLFKKVLGVHYYKVNPTDKGFVVNLEYNNKDFALYCWPNGCPDLSSLTPKEPILIENIKKVFEVHCENMVEKVSTEEGYELEY